MKLKTQKVSNQLLIGNYSTFCCSSEKYIANFIAQRSEIEDRQDSEDETIIKNIKKKDDRYCQWYMKQDEETW